MFRPLRTSPWTSSLPRKVGGVLLKVLQEPAQNKQQFLGEAGCPGKVQYPARLLQPLMPMLGPQNRHMDQLISYHDGLELTVLLNLVGDFVGGSYPD